MIDAERVLRAALRDRADGVRVPDDFDQRVARWDRRLTARRRRRRAATVVAAAAVVAIVAVLFVADADSPSDVVVAGTTGTTIDTAPSTAAEVNTLPTTKPAAPTSTTETTGAVERCNGSELEPLLGRFGYAAGSAGQTILVTNVGTRACSVVASPTIEALVSDNPGSPSAFVVATRLVLREQTPGIEPAPVTIRPGQSAQVMILAGNRQNYPDQRCPGAKLPEGIVGARLILPGGSTDWFDALAMGDYLCEPTMSFFTPAETAGTIRTISSPLGRRVSPAVVWTGSELMVWGGDNGSGNNVLFTGALYDPMRDRWRPMSTSVLHAAPVGAVWAKERVVFAASEVATYDPTTDRWSGYRSGIVEKNRPLLAYTGDDVIGWFFEVGVRGSGIRIDPNTTEIDNDIAAPPTPIGYDATPLWTGREWMIFPSTGHTGIAFDPGANRWRTLPPAPVEFVSRGLFTWTGTNVVAYGMTNARTRVLTGAAYDPASNTWKLLPAVPVPFSVLTRDVAFDAGPHLVWSGDHALLLTGSSDPDLALFVIDPYLTRAHPAPRLASAPEKATPLVAAGSTAYLILSSGDLAQITVG